MYLLCVCVMSVSEFYPNLANPMFYASKDESKEHAIAILKKFNAEKGSFFIFFIIYLMATQAFPTIRRSVRCLSSKLKVIQLSRHFPVRTVIKRRFIIFETIQTNAYTQQTHRRKNIFLFGFFFFFFFFEENDNQVD